MNVGLDKLLAESGFNSMVWS